MENTLTAHGFINLNKPTGISSAKALYKVRQLTCVRKSGHAGTLDPLASGVLVICLGKATKLVEKTMDHPKVYRTVIRLDVTSASFDAESAFQGVDVADLPDLHSVQETLGTFEGEISQVPPATSAIKIGGKPAYAFHRRNETVELAARAVRIYWVHLHRYEWPELDVELCVGRGTYVRALARDIGKRLGTGGCLTSLIRTRVGPFDVARACTFELLSKAANPLGYLVPIDSIVGTLDAPESTIPPRPQHPS